MDTRTNSTSVANTATTSIPSTDAALARAQELLARRQQQIRSASATPPILDELAKRRSDLLASRQKTEEKKQLMTAKMQQLAENTKRTQTLVNVETKKTDIMTNCIEKNRSTTAALDDNDLAELSEESQLLIKTHHSLIASARDATRINKRVNDDMSASLSSKRQRFTLFATEAAACTEALAKPEPISVIQRGQK